MAQKNPLANIPSWMDPAAAIAAFGSYRDMASYTRIMHGEPGVFDSNADAAYGNLPDGTIYSDGNRGGRLIDYSYGGGNNFGGGSNIGSSSTGSPSMSSDYYIKNSSAGHYIFEAAPKSSSEKPADNSGDQNQNQNQSYAYNSFKFTLDDQGNPSFTGPTDTEHSDGKWKIQEIAAKLSEGDYTRFKKSINDARVTKGLSKLYTDV